MVLVVNAITENGVPRWRYRLWSVASMAAGKLSQEG
jgi:hypothetical protein